MVGSVESRRCSTTSTALLNTSALGLQGYVDTLSPLIDMHLLDRSCVIVGKKIQILHSPTVASDPGLFIDVICTIRTQRVVGDNSHTAYEQSLTLIQRYCWMKRPRPTLRIRLHETGSTDVCFAHRWLTDVSFSNFS